MSIWVSSQDKDVLINASMFKVKFVHNARWHVTGDNTDLGEYSSGDDARRIIILLTQFVNELKDIERVTTHYSERTCKLSFENFVFQMPRKDFVELV